MTEYTQQRYYIADPQTITLEECAYHGAAHRFYGWGKQIDPRWDDQRRKAYEDAYERETENEESMR